MSMSWNRGEVVEKGDERGRRIVSAVFGEEVYEDVVLAMVLPPCMRIAGGDGMKVAAWPHLHFSFSPCCVAGAETHLGVRSKAAVA